MRVLTGHLIARTRLQFSFQRYVGHLEFISSIGTITSFSVRDLADILGIEKNLDMSQDAVKAPDLYASLRKLTE